MVLGYFGFGHIIYVSLLFTNAIAILNEERFLAKSESRLTLHCPADHGLSSLPMIRYTFTPR